MSIPHLSADDLYWEEIEDARRIPPERKLVLGLELFDRTKELIRAGIRLQHPDADERTVHRMLLKRLDMARQLENQP